MADHVWSQAPWRDLHPASWKAVPRVVKLDPKSAVNQTVIVCSRCGFWRVAKFVPPRELWDICGVPECDDEIVRKVMGS